MSMNTLASVALLGKPLVRFELTTHALRMRCSTPELQRQMLCAAAAYHTPSANASLFFRKIFPSQRNRRGKYTQNFLITTF